jgi:hypothetical protein
MMTFFSTEENKKAAAYTATICGILLLLFIFISWSVLPPTAPVIEDQIEINLGNGNFFHIFMIFLFKKLLRT